MKVDLSNSLERLERFLSNGKLQEALDVGKMLLREFPQNAEVQQLAGVAYQRCGEPAHAISHAKKAVELDPRSASGYSNLGSIYKENGNPEAMQCFIKALHLNSRLPQAWFNLAVILQEMGKLNEAETAYQQALYLNFRTAGMMNNLGLLFQKKREFDKARVYYREALRIDSAYTEAHFNLGTLFSEMNDPDAAVEYYRKTVEIDPGHYEAYNNMGVLFFRKRMLQEAMECYLKALQVKPEFKEAHNNLGNVLKDLGNTDEAAAHYQKAIEADAGYASAYNNLGTVWKDWGRLREAEVCYRKAVDLEEHSASYYSNLLLLLNYDTHYDPSTVFQEHLRFAARFPVPPVPVLVNDRSRVRRMRIGFISPDFRRHSVNYFLEPVITAMEHSRFEIFCYSDVLMPDEVTKRMQICADRWRDISRMTDEQAAKLINEDGVDILVDLAGHTGYNRMLVFARKPAPVQVSWLGYPNTTGLSQMDYRIVDRYTDPPGLTDDFYTEKLVRMPKSFITYAPASESPQVGDLPALKDGRMTFGSFNNFVKETPQVLRLWADIMKKIPGSRLALKARSFLDNGIRRHVNGFFAGCGIDAVDVELLSHAPSFSSHLALYNRIDIALDPFPYNGTTTTCEALWMGVPVITLSGNTHASRVGRSLLTNVGLQDFIAESEEEYVAKAVKFAGDLAGLSTVRANLRSMMAASPLTDVRKFTVCLQECFEQMWRETVRRKA